MDINKAAFGVKHKPKRPNLDFQNFDKIGTRKVRGRVKHYFFALSSSLFVIFNYIVLKSINV